MLLKLKNKKSKRIDVKVLCFIKKNDKLREGVEKMPYTVKEVAEKLNCNEVKLLEKIKLGKLKAKKGLGTWLISEENYLEYTQGIEEPISVKDFAKMVRKCTKCIRDNVIAGKIKGVKIGGKWYVDKKELDRFI